MSFKSSIDIKITQYLYIHVPLLLPSKYEILKHKTEEIQMWKIVNINKYTYINISKEIRNYALVHRLKTKY